MNHKTIEIPIYNTNEEGKFVIAENVEHILFDIGASFTAVNSYNNINENVFIVAVEPDPRAWISYFSLFWHTDEGKNQNKLHRSEIYPINPQKYFHNFVFIPCAIVNSADKFIELHLSLRTGANSVLEISDDWNFMKSELNPITVPCMTLENLINMVPEDRRISAVKIDCQGYDDKVIQSAGKSIERVDFLSVECGTHESNQYKNSYSVDKFKKYFEEIDFEIVNERPGDGGHYLLKNKKSNLKHCPFNLD
jgi:FkbM family methyltransferase